jgi:multiple sugar transport system substrate-binding protein
MDTKNRRWLATGLVIVSMLLPLMAWSTAKQEASTGQITLRMYAYTWPVEKGVAEETAAAFQEENPNVTVKVEFPQKQDFGTLAAEYVTGAIADVLIQPAWDRGWMGNFTSKEMFVRMDDYISKDRDIRERDFYQFTLDTLSRGKQLYGLPLGFDVIMLQYNKEMFADAGLQTPKEYADQKNWNWTTFAEAGKKLTKFDDKGNMSVGGYIMDTNWAWSAYWSYSNGVTSYFSPDLKENYFDDPRVIEALDYIQDAIYRDKWAPNPIEEQELNIWYWFANGKLAMNRATWQQFGAEYEGIDFDVAVLPKKEQLATLMYGMGVGVTSKAEHPDVAYRLARMYQDKFLSRTVQEGYMAPAHKSALKDYIAEHTEKDTSVLMTMAEGAHPFQWDLALHEDWNTDYSAWTSDMDRIISPAFDRWSRNEVTSEEMLTQLAEELREYARTNIK